MESRGVFVVFYLGYDEGELWVMFGGLNGCLREVWVVFKLGLKGWFEGKTQGKKNRGFG